MFVTLRTSEVFRPRVNVNPYIMQTRHNLALVDPQSRPVTSSRVTQLIHQSTITNQEMRSPWISTLGKDPSHRQNRLNGVSYQEDALTTFNGWQYAIYYSARDNSDVNSKQEPLYIHLARRPLTHQTWDEILVFDDYPQTTDDGHNTAQLGICHGDGTIHLSYDHHCDM